jgi:hypothetical protein
VEREHLRAMNMENGKKWYLCGRVAREHLKTMCNRKFDKFEGAPEEK